MRLISPLIAICLFGLLPATRQILCAGMKSVLHCATDSVAQRFADAASNPWSVC